MTVLPIHTHGPPDGLPIVLLHGFLADSRQWSPLIAAVEAQVHRPLRWILPDLPGHGDAATVFPPHAGWTELNKLLARSLQPHLRGAALLAGYSMGGRIAASLAASRALDLRGVWLESAHPPLSDAVQHARQAEDEERARTLTSGGIAPFVATWENLPLFASQKGLPPEVLERQRTLRLAQDPQGLARSLRWYGTGTMPTTLHIALPVRMLAGALDAKLCARLDEWRHFAPDFSATIVANAGHAVHLEQLWATATHLAASISES